MPIEGGEKTANNKEEYASILSDRKRVRLRPWKESDQVVLAAIFADPKIAAFISSVAPEESGAAGTYRYFTKNINGCQLKAGMTRMVW